LGGDEAIKLVAEAVVQIALRYDVPLEPLVLSLHEYLEDTLFTREVKRTGKILYSVNSCANAEEQGKVQSKSSTSREGGSRGG